MWTTALLKAEQETWGGLGGSKSFLVLEGLFKHFKSPSVTHQLKEGASGLCYCCFNTGHSSAWFFLERGSIKNHINVFSPREFGLPGFVCCVQIWSINQCSKWVGIYREAQLCGLWGCAFTIFSELYWFYIFLNYSPSSSFVPSSPPSPFLPSLSFLLPQIFIELLTMCQALFRFGDGTVNETQSQPSRSWHSSGRQTVKGGIHRLFQTGWPGRLLGGGDIWTDTWRGSTSDGERR